MRPTPSICVVKDRTNPTTTHSSCCAIIVAIFWCLDVLLQPRNLLLLSMITNLSISQQLSSFIWYVILFLFYSFLVCWIASEWHRALSQVVIFHEMSHRDPLSIQVRPAAYLLLLLLYYHLVFDLRQLPTTLVNDHHRPLTHVELCASESWDHFIRLCIARSGTVDRGHDKRPSELDPQKLRMIKIELHNWRRQRQPQDMMTKKRNFRLTWFRAFFILYLEWIRDCSFVILWPPLSFDGLVMD